MIDRSLLGRGPSFPLNRSERGGLKYTEELERINQSLFIIFETPKGSRLMLPEFGSDLWKYRFDPLDSVLLEKIRYTITKDVERWEPRILITKIDFLSSDQDIDNNILYVSLDYQLINAEVTGNYVYPYKRETYNSI